MSRRLPDEMFDARLVAYLEDRAEDGAARARTPEQVATDIAGRLRPTYRVRPVATPVLRLAWLVVLVALLLVLLTSLLAGGRLPWVSPPRIVRIAIELPLGGSDQRGAPIADGIMLAVSDAAGQTGPFRIEIPPSAILSDLVGGLPDASQGAANMRRIVADPDVVAVIGPFSSTVAEEQIPISSAAGLLQCSPANTNPQLTRTADNGVQPAGSPAPSRANYIRTVTTDDVAAAGAARYLFSRLGKTSVYVIDDNQGYGMAMADWFGAEFARLGGTVLARAHMPDSNGALPATLATARAKNPQAIYFGGTGDRGASLLRAAVQAGLGQIPFVGTDSLNDGSAATPGSFLNLADNGAQHVFSVFPGLADGPGKTAFEARYRALYGADPTPFAALGYACAQVVIAALQRADTDPATSTTSLRDAVRAWGVKTNTTFQTIVGPISFDARGDVTPKRVSIYTRDAANDWVYADQIEAAAGFGR
ncbi:MAG: branched-chain amino acid ABC transporter substrate-binding protein [Chloroflexota bacterium]